MKLNGFTFIAALCAAPGIAMTQGMANRSDMVDPTKAKDADTIYQVYIAAELSYVRGRFVARDETADGRVYNFVECEPSLRVRNLPAAHYKEDLQSSRCVTSAAVGTFAQAEEAILYNWTEVQDLVVTFAAGSVAEDCFVDGWATVLHNAADTDRMTGTLVGGYIDGTIPDGPEALRGYAVVLGTEARSMFGIDGAPTAVDVRLPTEAVRLGVEEGKWVATVAPGGCEADAEAAPLQAMEYVPFGQAGGLPTLAVPVFHTGN
ncbi:hypothetical protein [uncultured Jannaschia sp.]|uniref:hypothetical protein n=1 Tax=uncultured Jannaschia sp. TaxID=293347 RepID=UPI002629FF38|nr:hypothetical protein [uncultured Jannaschia sp.]